jgi:hypothetical protein
MPIIPPINITPYSVNEKNPHQSTQLIARAFWSLLTGQQSSHKAIVEAYSG